MAEKRLHATVSGSVQGVSFRYYARQKAQELGLKGFVKNLPDGKLEVVAEGEKEKLKELEQWLRHGPDGARVTEISANWSDSIKEFSEFEVRI